MLVAYLDNQFYPILLEYLSRSLQERGYQIVLIMTDPGSQDEVVRQIMQYQVQGIVMASATMSSNLAKECADTGIPVVMLNRYVSTSSASSVTSDNIEGGRLVADFLVRGGHEKIAYIAGAEDASTNRDREAGFYKGLAEHGMTAIGRSVGGYSFEGAADAARDLFSRKDRPDGIFVANDHMAFSVMDVIRDELGLRIPEDVSIIGYDDVPEASWKGYNLTTVSQSPMRMIEEAVSILSEQIEERAVRKRAAVLPAKIVVRKSAKIPTK
jgi:DNA-binding LacI/PurR family transcriptional regulator